MDRFTVTGVSTARAFFETKFNTGALEIHIFRGKKKMTDDKFYWLLKVEIGRITA
jgi:hypothetical protein